MSPSLQLTAIALRVPDLARSVDFYTRQLGFVALPAVGGAAAGRADLAVAPTAPAILTLIEDCSALAPPRRAAGLFHAALLLPDRGALGAWLRFAAENGVEFDGFSDHAVSEAIYLTDPHGNGLEFYADRARADWPFAANGEVTMTTRPLAVPALLAAAPPASATPLAGARWGHLHLRVTDLERSEAFYHDALGLEVTQRSYPGARFMAADGYHHHVAVNTWGQSREPQPLGTLGLASATFARAGLTGPRSLRDPDGIALELIPFAA